MSAGRWTKLPLAALLLTLFVGIASKASDPAKQRDEQRTGQARVADASRRASSTIDAMLYQRLSPTAAHLLGGLAFAGHHIVVLWVYAGPLAGVLLGLVVGGAGVCWSLLRQRHGSLVGAWIAHACCDVAIFILGWWALHPAAA